MSDRLRELLDLVIAAPPDAGGAELARRANFSRDHLDRLLARATGESPAALRRRLLLERAAWQLRHGAAATDAATAAGYGSQAAFSRAFARAFGAPPSRHDGPTAIDAPNGIHFHPPAGLLVPSAGGPPRDLTERLVRHHIDRTRALLVAAATLDPEILDRRARPGLVVVWLEGEEDTAALLAERLVFALEVWTAAIVGEPAPLPASGPLLDRFDRAARAFERLARTIRDREAWDAGFVDALCEPPESFSYGGVLTHMLTFGAVRREHLAGVLAEHGVEAAVHADPLMAETRQGVR